MALIGLGLALLAGPELSAHNHGGNGPEAKLAKLGIELPTPGESIANYVRARRVGNTIYLSGHIPFRADGSLIKGKLGRDLGVEAGYHAARRSAVGLLASLKAEIGDLSKVEAIIKVFGMVNATGEFTDHSKVINGCSDLLVEVFGEKGRHARAACGFASLPLGSAVEIEMIVLVAD